jgi:electron transport complex protein RnfD
MTAKQMLLRQRPLVNLARSTSSRMWAVSVCAFAAVVQSSLTDSFASLFLALSALAAALITELLLTWKEKRFASIGDGSAAASAMVLVLLLPNRISPVCAVFGAVFAMAVVKHSFGGLGSNWLNPAAGAWLFLRISWPDAFMSALEGSPLSIVSAGLEGGLSNPEGSPMGILKIAGNGTGWAASALDGFIRSALNGAVFSPVKAELPSGYIDLFMSRAPGIVADRGLAALLLGTVIVVAFQAGRLRAPAVYLAVYAFLVRAAGGLPFGGTPWSGDMLFGIFSGGVVAAAFFLAAEPVTGAKSRAGTAAAAALAGFFSWFFRYQGFVPYGAFFAILTVNAACLIIRNLEFRFFYSGRRDAPR